ncbi:hypothetical protein Tco_0583561 [Tanacetum coccineum]
MMGLPQEEVERVILKLLSFGLFEAADFNSCLADFFCLVIIDGEISNNAGTLAAIVRTIGQAVSVGTIKSIAFVGDIVGLTLLMELQPVDALSYRQSLNLLASVATLNYQFRV